MGAGELRGLTESLARKQRPVTAGDLQAISDSVGDHLSADEATILQSFVDGHRDRFDRSTLDAITLFLGTAQTNQDGQGRHQSLGKLHLDLDARYTTNVPEQSGLAFISEDFGFVTVDDATNSVFRIPPPPGRVVPRPALRLDTMDPLSRVDSGRATAQRLGTVPDTDGLEAITYDREANSLLVVGENDSSVTEIPFFPDGRGLRLSERKRLGVLVRAGLHGNKGYEGLCILPGAKTLDHRPRILAVHEEYPKALGIFDRETLKLEAEIAFPRAMDEAMIDASDITFDPKTNHLLFLSDRSRLICEADLVPSPPMLGREKYVLIPIATASLPEASSDRRLQPEGITVDEGGDIWVASEGDQSLMRLSRA